MQTSLDHLITPTTLVSSIPEAIYVCDTEGRLIFFNQAAVKLWGRTPVANDEYWTGAHKTYTADGIEMARGECPASFMLQERREVEGVEGIIERPDGERRNVSALFQFVRDHSGEIAGVIIMVIDITERKRLEEGLRLMNLNKDKFISTLSHELRNPIQPILASADIIKGTSDDWRINKSADVIIRQTHQLSQLISEVMDMSKVNFGHATLRLNDVRIEEVFKPAFEKVKTLFSAKNQSFQATLPPMTASVRCDVVKVTQTIDNLLVNASKYSEAGKRVYFEAEIKGINLFIRVIDEGIGISPDKLDTIFKMYEQVERHSPDAQSGMGIGLALVKSFVELHGGTVLASSEGLGKGSRVEVRLPIVI